MGNVSKGGIWTPDENDSMELDVNLAAMASSIDNGWGKRVEYLEGEDTGWILGSPSTGWTKDTGGDNLTPGYVRGRRRGYMVELMLRLTRSGPPITPGTHGNVENQRVATVPRELIPTSWWHSLSSGPVGGLLGGTIDSNGDIQLTAVPAGFTLNPGYQISLGGSYFIDLGPAII